MTKLFSVSSSSDNEGKSDFDLKVEAIGTALGLVAISVAVLAFVALCVIGVIWVGRAVL